MRKQIALAALIGLIGFGCKETKQPTAVVPLTPAPVIEKDTTGRVICHIVSRHQTITVKSGDHGVIYSVRGADGTLLLADATPAEFEKADPQLFRQIQHYIAVQADPSAAVEASSVEPIPISIDAER